MKQQSFTGDANTAPDGSRKCSPAETHLRSWAEGHKHRRLGWNCDFQSSAPRNETRLGLEVHVHETNRSPIDQNSSVIMEPSVNGIGLPSEEV